MEKAHVWRASPLCDRRTSTTVTVESPKVSFLHGNQNIANFFTACAFILIHRIHLCLYLVLCDIPYYPLCVFLYAF